MILMEKSKQRKNEEQMKMMENVTEATGETARTDKTGPKKKIENCKYYHNSSLVQHCNLRF